MGGLGGAFLHCANQTVTFMQVYPASASSQQVFPEQSPHLGTQRRTCFLCLWKRRLFFLTFIVSFSSSLSFFLSPPLFLCLDFLCLCLSESSSLEEFSVSSSSCFLFFFFFFFLLFFFSKSTSSESSSSFFLAGLSSSLSL